MLDRKQNNVTAEGISDIFYIGNFMWFMKFVWLIGPLWTFWSVEIVQVNRRDICLCIPIKSIINKNDPIYCQYANKH